MLLATDTDTLANAKHSHYSARMIVCVCQRVSDRDIARAVREGCANFDDLQSELAVATCCGACHDCARQTFHQQLALAPAVAAAQVTVSTVAAPPRPWSTARGQLFAQRPLTLPAGA